MITKEEAIKAYDQLIQLRRTEQLVRSKENPGKIETHHILPRSCGGEDIPENRIDLLAKEHFMAHVYLWVIHHRDEFHYQTMHALNMMVKGTLNGPRKELRDFILQSEEYQKAREEFAQYTSETIRQKVSGKKNGAYGKHWYHDPNTLETKMLKSSEIPYGWIKGRILPDQDRSYTIEHLMIEANNKERKKRINACREVFFSMYYDYYLEYGFDLTIKKFDLQIERTALLHMFKKYVPYYKAYNRWK